ncbi:MAG: glycoside hydrolase family 88 protein [Eubacterium sp.]|jgi:rhamnogalacturonyl hydrolase YesR|nr:glycoside hydrolase family 88 protein [Eubacterium sp.]
MITLNLNKIINASLCLETDCFGRGFIAQSLCESGEDGMLAAYSYALVNSGANDRQTFLSHDRFLVADPAVSGEAVLRAFELTGDTCFKANVDNMLGYLMMHAPRTTDGVIFHYKENYNVGPGYTPMQIWACDCYAAPPFLAVMGELTEATKQYAGFYNYLVDERTGLFFESYDIGSNMYVSQRLSGTGNALALLGAARMIANAAIHNKIEVATDLSDAAVQLLKNILKFQLDDGLFYKILNDPLSPRDTATALMAACVIYRGISEGWLEDDLRQNADKAIDAAEKQINEYGFIQNPAGMTALTQSAFIIANAWQCK